MDAIQIVVENHAQEGLAAEHGFALWIKSAGRVILFDTGNKGALFTNLHKLGLDLGALTDLVLSHGHYDHAGGVETVLEVRRDIQVYLHQAAMQPRYVKENDGSRSVRMPPGSMRALWNVADDSIHWLTHPVNINDRIGLSGPIPRNTSFEDTGGSFYFDPHSERPDPIEDDNALWFSTRDGLVICDGCSHAGIVNTIEAVLSNSGESKVDTVVGGLHLLNASPERLERTARALEGLHLKRIVACHCTGDDAREYLRKRLNCEVVRGFAGMSLTF